MYTLAEKRARDSEIVGIWNNDPSLTYEALGTQFALTRERIRQILASDPQSRANPRSPQVHYKLVYEDPPE